MGTWKNKHMHTYSVIFDFYTELITYIDCTFITCIRRDLDYECFSLRQLHFKDSNSNIVLKGYITTKSENSINADFNK